MMKSQAVPLHPIWDINHPFLQCIHTKDAICYASIRHLVDILLIRLTVTVSHCLCSSDPYFKFNSGLKAQELLAI